MRKKIRISTLGVAQDYYHSLIPNIIKHLGYSIEWSSPKKADLIIFGPFFKKMNRNRWTPKPLRPLMAKLLHPTPALYRQPTLFQTGENLRHNHIQADFSLSFDLAVDSVNHLRLPYWMELVDWSDEGITGTENPRFGRPIDLKRLRQPLGKYFLEKPFQAALFASHVREPRETLFNVVGKIIPIYGFGHYFDKNIEDHNSSGFLKIDVLEKFAFNLCPENGMYPGYYSEKIPEAFMANCLPLAWVDDNVAVDFNPNAFINLAPMMRDNFSELRRIMQSRAELEKYASQALLTNQPSIEKHKYFIKEIVKQALS